MSLWKLAFPAAAVAAVLQVGTLSHAATITDPLTGSGNLDNTPAAVNDVNPADRWEAPTSLTRTAGGTAIATGSATTDDVATLGFTPVSGNVYQLSTTLTTGGGSGGDWLYIAFVNKRTTTNLFDGGTLQGPFALIRTNAASASDPAGAVYAFAGPGASNQFASDPDNGAGTHTLTLELDTTAAAWKVRFLEDGVQIGSPHTYQTNPTISAVSFGAYQSATGTALNFSLTTVPEPASAALFGAGALCLLARRRA